ncbi:AraC-type DNA-binding protein [Filimonas lacunae]|uniref:AraC-type DNA-binding protein n=1 Tax=Filimonas lacunae TaxID=477680 RepID=A0A173MG45_9BACT|nr:helix-turn-helix domain-containing protein [Filimonas lacunae]BAV06459.1 transcriptional regulator, AraC family [Filimonas lacunae]SIT27036.1 AraC-type DNA-binding protein [Filimonas lacunae]
MRKNAGAIPVNNFGSESDGGIAIERISFESLPDLGEWEQPERHDRHSFFLLEKGSVTMEIDFQQYLVNAPSIIYMHPDQVHRILTFENVIVNAWAANNENLNPEYLVLLEDIAPAIPMPLNHQMFVLFTEAISLCIKLAEREKDPLYHSILKDQTNVLTGLIISLYRALRTPSEDTLSRPEVVTKAFKEALGLHFVSCKRPAEYAQKLNLSTAYLNECVKNSTGHSVSYHIQQRVVLEAKRLLHHSKQSLKEIAATLGYDDYAYFSRLFTKVSGVAPVTFRNKNPD